MQPRALPYLVFSLAAHGGLAILLLLWRLPPVPELLPRRVVVEFAPPAAGRRPAAGPPAQPLRAVPGMRLPEGKPLTIPPASSLSDAGHRAVLPPEAPQRLPATLPRVSEASGAAALPTPGQALRELGAPGLPDAPAESPTPAPASEASGYAQATALEWKEGERTVLLPPRLRFPDLLLQKGLEVDVQAAFDVAPSGQVIHVRITRSSGFASVDRAVEQALRDALFEESSREDSGRIQFRFRLERKE